MGETKQELIRSYKTLLKGAVEACPSGIRLQIAHQIGKNKSFVSQITNPNYKTPLPEKYIEAIFETVHLTEAERDRFLELYRRAHPRYQASEPSHYETRVLTVELPRMESRQLETKIDQMITQFARNVSDMALQR